jgi:hypothetical protein
VFSHEIYHDVLQSHQEMATQQLIFLHLTFNFGRNDIADVFFGAIVRNISGLMKLAVLIILAV